MNVFPRDPAAMNHPSVQLAACLFMGLLGSFVGHKIFASESRSSVRSNTGSVQREAARATDPRLLARMDALEDRVTELSLAAPESGGARAPRASEAVVTQGSDALEELARRLETLETRLSAQEIESAAAPRSPRYEEQSEREQRTVEEAQMRVLEPGATEAEKLRAWSQLRDGGWTEEIVAEMIAVARSTTDPEVRADIWRQADAKNRSLQLVGPLLDSLAHDENASVRSEAAETLENYIDQPGVREALEYALQHDPDQGVRKEARGALN